MTQPLPRTPALLPVALACLALALMGACSTSEPGPTAAPDTTSVGEATPARPTSSSAGTQTTEPRPKSSATVDASPTPTPTSGSTTGGDTSGTTDTTSTPAGSSFTPGDIDETVPMQEVTTQPVTPLSEEAQFDERLSAEVIDVAEVEGVAHGPGEVDGPAVAMTVQLQNDTDRVVRVNGSIVDLQYGDGVSATQLAGPPSKAFPATVAAKDSVTGVFVYLLPDDPDQTFTIRVQYSSEAPLVVFEGKLP